MSTVGKKSNDFRKMFDLYIATCSYDELYDLSFKIYVEMTERQIHHEISTYVDDIKG